MDFDRKIAYKVSINDIVKARYVKQEGWNPNFIIDAFGRKVARVNVVGVVLSKGTDFNFNLIRIDDGSASIDVRSFNEENPFVDLEIGDIVYVIGKPRSFNSQNYIIAEIVKKENNKGILKLRKLEIELEKKKTLLNLKNSKTKGDNIYSMIKELDAGNGADINELIEQASSKGIKNAEKIVKKLLESGDIFEIKPGRLKVIE